MSSYEGAAGEQLVRCPLIEGVVYDSADIPETCQRFCGRLMTTAMAMSPPPVPYDEYPQLEPSDCEHYSLQYSSDSLQAPEGAEHPARFVAVVDECEACHLEIGEQAYGFDCTLVKWLQPKLF